jgi:hypothetical protein
MSNISGHEKRKRDLLKMGYGSFEEYLKSPLWRRIRSTVYKVKGRVCKLCGKKAYGLHHRHYNPKVLRGDRLEPMVPLCKSCKRKVEYHSDGKPRNFGSSYAAYARLSSPEK